MLSKPTGIKEFGGDNLETLQQLSEQFLESLDAQSRRYPKRRNQHNGRLERRHRTDDEEFY